MDIDLYDEIKIYKSKNFSVHIEYDPSLQIKDDLRITPQNCLIEKTVRLFENESNINVNLAFVLIKHIPIGAGLGGGSSNAAYLLQWLQKYYNHKLTKEKEVQLAMKLGCDVVYFLNPRPVWVSSFGECIKHIEIIAPNELYILLVCPYIYNSTPKMYGEFKKQGTEFSQEISQVPQSIDIDWFKYRGNDFMKVIESEKIHNIIKTLEQMQGCLFARLSGSGSACFGIFNNKEKRDKAFELYKATDPTNFIVSCGFVNL